MHTYRVLYEIHRANRDHCTQPAIIKDGEVISGRMPADDYKLAWVSADGWLSAQNREHELPKAMKSPNKDEKRKC